MFLSVIVLGPESVAIGWFPKAMLAGVTWAFACVPVPESASACPPTFSVACSAPVPLGEKCMLNVHEALAGTTPPQVFALMPKSAASAPPIVGPVGFAS